MSEQQLELIFEFDVTEYQRELIDYVMVNNAMNEPAAIAWLDKWAPHWRDK